MELSLDRGKTWRKLPLINEIWRYDWVTLKIPNGKYKAIVRAWNIAGNVQSPGDSVTLIVVNRPPDKKTSVVPVVPSVPLTLTLTRTSTPSPTLTITTTSTHEIQPTQTVTAVPTPIATATPAPPVSTLAGKPLAFWPIVGLIGLLMALASASLTDHRPQALRRIRQTFDKIVARSQPDDGE